MDKYYSFRQTIKTFKSPYISSMDLFNSNNLTNQLPSSDHSRLTPKAESPDQTPIINFSYYSNFFDQFNNHNHSHLYYPLPLSDSNSVNHSFVVPNLSHCQHQHQSYLSSIKSDSLMNINKRNSIEDSFTNVNLGQFHTRIGNNSEEPKPNFSYIGLIAKAILSTADQRMILSEIYQWIQINYPYFRTRGPGWRNSIRHNLSLNDCFVKVGRAANGKGHYWGIHPANLRDFLHGDFRRRRAQRKVRQALGLSCPADDRDTPSPSSTSEQSSPRFVSQLNSLSHLKTQSHLSTPNICQPKNVIEEPSVPSVNSCLHDSLRTQNRITLPFSCSIKTLTHKVPLANMNTAQYPSSNQTNRIQESKGDPMLRLIYTNLLKMFNQLPVINEKLSKMSSPHIHNVPACKIVCSSPSRLGDKCSFSVANLLDDGNSKWTNSNLGQTSLVNPFDSEIRSFSVDACECTENVSAALLDSSDGATSHPFSILKSNIANGQRGELISPLDYTLAGSNLQQK